MIEINSRESLKNTVLDKETEYISGLILDLFSVLFETDNFSEYASLFCIFNENELDNYENMRLSEKLSADGFEFVDIVSIKNSTNQYYLACVIPSDSFGIYILANCNIIKRNKEIFKNSNSRHITLDENSTYKNFL